MGKSLLPLPSLNRSLYRSKTLPSQPGVCFQHLAQKSRRQRRVPGLVLSRKAQGCTGPGPVSLPGSPLRVWSATSLAALTVLHLLTNGHTARHPQSPVAKHELHTKARSFWNDPLETSWFRDSLAHIFQWSSELPRWTAWQERRKGPRSWADCRWPAGGAAACSGGPSPAAGGAKLRVSLTPDLHTTAPRPPRTFTTEHFHRREEKVLTPGERTYDQRQCRWVWTQDYNSHTMGYNKGNLKSIADH